MARIYCSNAQQCKLRIPVSRTDVPFGHLIANLWHRTDGAKHSRHRRGPPERERLAGGLQKPHQEWRALFTHLVEGKFYEVRFRGFSELRGGPHALSTHFGRESLHAGAAVVDLG